MPDELKPSKHGRDHCPGGEDPIPCLSAAHWCALYDNFIVGQDIISNGGVQEIYFPYAVQSDGSEEVFEIVTDANPPGEFYNNIRRVKLLVPSVITFSLSVHWEGGDQSHQHPDYMLGGFDYPGRVLAHHFRLQSQVYNWTNYNDWEHWDVSSVTLPVYPEGDGTITPAIIFDRTYLTEVYQDGIYSRLNLTYHGPLNSDPTDWPP